MILAFKLSKEMNVQLRAYYPEKATLEDVFINTLDKQNGSDVKEGGYEHGN